MVNLLDIFQLFSQDPGDLEITVLFTQDLELIVSLSRNNKVNKKIIWTTYLILDMNNKKKKPTEWMNESINLSIDE